MNACNATQNEMLDMPELCTALIDKVESYITQHNDVAHRVVWIEAISGISDYDSKSIKDVDQLKAVTPLTVFTPSHCRSRMEKPMFRIELPSVDILAWGEYQDNHKNSTPKLR